mmetsp:Transcript_6510/g.14734  ORF Transcript_6510/g.14734 Transcript_6510/m.14734 type:complete len:318 (-) Transcript_6510:135-1088(-)
MRANAILSAMAVLAALTAETSLAFTVRPGAQRGSTSSNIELRAALATTASPTILSPQDMKKLADDGFVIIHDFIKQDLIGELRNDVLTLRENDAFRQAKIGQDSTNNLNTEIRIAETCFLGRNRNELLTIEAAGGKDSVRDRSGGLYDILDNLRVALEGVSETGLDSSLTELLFAYYPKGGFYRRHRDAIPNSASLLRKYSLLLYLNQDWSEKDGGQLRIHLDGGGDECPAGVAPKFIDVEPKGGTLVLFKSDAIPHEVLNTNSERFAVVGWYNRGVSAADIGNLGKSAGGGDLLGIGMLAVSAALVTVGLVMVFNG